MLSLKGGVVLYRADFSIVPPRLVEAEKPLKVVCAWCQKVMRDGQSEKVSHGICDSCVDIFRESIGRERREG